MTAKLFVSAAFSSLPRLLRPQILNFRPGFLPSVANSSFEWPIRRIVGLTDRKFSFSSMAMAGESLGSSPAVPKSVPVQVAHELLQGGHRYLDVRTPEEFSAGHAVGAINVPYLFRAGSGMTKNPNFLEGVSSHFAKEDAVIVGCQAGKRSLMAATDLLSAGYTGVTDVAGGYAAWTQNGLPIES